MTDPRLARAEEIVDDADHIAWSAMSARILDELLNPRPREPVCLFGPGGDFVTAIYRRTCRDENHHC